MIKEKITINTILLFFKNNFRTHYNKSLFLSFIYIYVFTGLIWREAHSLYSEGLIEYSNDLWNIVDFITNVFYMVWISLRFSSWFIVQVSRSVNLFVFIFI